MSVDMVMPSLIDGMESGTIISWLLDDGAVVAPGDDLLEVETDKATATVAAEQAGVLRIVVPVGGTATVGDIIAHIGADDARTPDPGARTTSARNAAPTPELSAATDATGASEAPIPAPAREDPAHLGVKASPVARRVALSHGVDLTALTGSGPGGRIVSTDVERAAGIESVASAPAPALPDGATPSAPADAAPRRTATRPVASAGRGEVTSQELSRVQAVVARRMALAKAEAPDFVIGVEVDMEQAVALRERLKVLVEDERPPSFNDFVVKASALALREFPRANGAYVDGRFELFEHVNVGIAVAAEDALVVPTIFHADRKSLGAIGRESRRLAADVRDGKAALIDLSGGTFTVSNLGMFGISEFTSILNPPQAAILSVGEMKRTPVEHDGKIALRHMMKMRLTCDHRILYGADAAGFLQRIKRLLQAPLAMSL